jgi:hypothetical protein
VLLELGDRLDDLLDANNEELWPILHQRGYYSCFWSRRARQSREHNETVICFQIRSFTGR